MLVIMLLFEFSFVFCILLKAELSVDEEYVLLVEKNQSCRMNVLAVQLVFLCWMSSLGGPVLNWFISQQVTSIFY